MHHLRELRAQRTVGADAARHHQALKAGLIQRAFALDHQRIHHRVFKRAGDIGTRLLTVIVIADGIRREGFQPGEAEIQPRTVSHWAREDKAPFRTLRGHFRQHRAARVIQTQQLGGFVEGFTSGIVDRLAQQLVLANARDANQLRMTAGDQQRHKRERRRIVFQHRRQKMPFHMVNRNRWHIPREGQRTADRCADQQRADQTRTCGIGHGINIG